MKASAHPVSHAAGPWNRSDRRIIFSATFVRAVATSMTGVLLGIYLQRLRFSDLLIGAVIASGLAGGAIAALIATVAADRVGRRRFLLSIAVLSAAGGFAVAFSSAETIIIAAALLGMINGMGRDRGAALIIEQAILPATAPDRERTNSFAKYNVLQAAGAALGALAAGFPTFVERDTGMSRLAAMRAGIAVYAGLMLLVFILYLFLSPAVESDKRASQSTITPHTRSVVSRLSALFLLDSIGGGFMTQAMIAYFFVAHFGASPAAVAALFFGAAIANALSQFAAAWLAGRIGLVNTMVFTHIPGNLLMTAAVFAPSFPAAAVLFLARESLVQMDVPTRQSYVMAVVLPGERTFASGATGLVRMGGWALAPTVAGLTMQRVAMATPFIIGPALKVTYDLLLYRAFRHLRPPEERAT